MSDAGLAGDRPVVLIADDDSGIRALFRTVLSAAGYDVIEAVDGVDALAKLSTTEVSLVVLDSSMPRLDGLGVIRGLRSVDATARLPVIMVTGAAEESRNGAPDLETPADGLLP